MNSKVPPSWSPERDRQYPLRTWTQDVRLWALGTDIDPLKQGPVVAARIAGTAKELIRELDPNILAHGAAFPDENGNIVQFTGLEALVRALSRRYAPLAQELEVFCIAEILQFQRKPGEDTDGVISRFELTRTKAVNGAGFDMSWIGFSFLLLTILGIQRTSWPLILAPTLGRLPNTAQQYQEFCEYVRRHGHLTDRGVDSVKNMNFLAVPNTQTSSAIMPVSHSNTSWNSSDTWNQQAYHVSDAGFGNSWDTEYALAYVADGTESDISSCNSIGSEPDLSDLHGMPYDTAGEKLYLAYRHHKRRWRKFVGGRKRRFGRKGKGKGGKAGKYGGKSFGKGSGKGGKTGKKGRWFYVDEFGTTNEDEYEGEMSAETEWNWQPTEQLESSVFLGKGKGKRKNPKGKDGKTLLCSGCGADDHFVKYCPKNSQNLPQSSFQTKSFVTSQSQETHTDSASSSGWGSMIYLGHQKTIEYDSRSVIELFDGTRIELNTLEAEELPSSSTEPKRNYYMPTTAVKPATLSQSGKPGASDELIKMFAFVWFMPPAFHAQVRIASGDALLIDPGAYDNLVGSKFVERVGAIAQQAGQGMSWQKLKKQLEVEGVGKGADHTNDAVTMPICFEDGTSGTYHVPVIPDSQLPALLGLKALSKYKAVLDTHNKQLILVGAGGYKLQLSPGSKVLALQSAPTGHLMLPCCCWNGAKVKPGQPGVAL